MKHALVTGCAGFIGSKLCERLLEMGYKVTGIDCFTPNYDIWIKKRNLEHLLTSKHFNFVEKNINHTDLSQILKGVQYIFHQAAMPGVRSSWGKEFDRYVDLNILSTQHLLEAAKEKGVDKFIYASSSSVYGEMDGPTDENKLPRPYSPYGVTKLSGEHLCHLYYKNFNLPVISLRYFTVYGERQRPDMAFHKFIKNIFDDKPITIYGDGLQSRDFTYIDDAVEANILALHHGKEGEVYNIGGNRRIPLKEVINKMEKIIGKPIKIKYVKAVPGDPKHTWADISKAKRELNYTPQWTLDEGLKREANYIKNLYS